MILRRSRHKFGIRTVILMVLIIGAIVVPVLGALTDTGVTISADGDQSYYQGEKIILRGQNTDSDNTYLFLTGPNLQAEGVNLASPKKAVISGDPDSFTAAKTKPDNTWEYSFYTANLNLDAGTYTIYALDRPETNNQPDPSAASLGIILKKPFINAELSSLNIVKGQTFSVTGTAEGIPFEVQIWIIGDDYVYTTKTQVNSDASFTFYADAAVSGRLPAGQNYLIVQHPMADNQFDFVLSGDYVRSLNMDNGINVFKITGQRSLQGSEAADALTAAISIREANNNAYSCDTYTIIPFQVTDGGSTTPGATNAKTAPLQYALLGVIVVAAGIVIWKRH